MWIIHLITLYAGAVRGHADQVMADHTDDAQVKIVDNMVNKLCDRLLDTLHVHHTDMDGLTLGKPGDVVVNAKDSSPSLSDKSAGVSWAKWGQRALVAGAVLTAGKMAMKGPKSSSVAAPDEWVPQVSDPGSWKALPQKEFNQADRLLAKKGRTAADCELAASLYRNMLAQVDPKSSQGIELKIKTADALNAAMRLQTNGNVLMIEGAQDTPEHKKVWSRLAPGALELSKAAWEEEPNNPKACGVYVDAAQYEGSTKGIVKQALTGGGKKFIDNAKALQKFPEEEAGLGWMLEGAFYLAAPRPIKNPKKALGFIQKSVDISSTRRNLYYLGLAHFRNGQMQPAVEAWQKSLAAPPGSHNEADVADYVASQARIGIEKAEKQLPK
eukprot:gnl/MRDRNA2_/MRDRNA2_121850_c0_seq1.p1 gnl/MRDRNA2_/MRDRNA2_121850_c0~~gnl/MRDRNA2_/MRDRNA2_121850_c0_seq1.p1  ORF type:complete len:384 (+),score=97.15 gnl/MRDRNA2_/MRDRNA2_121850_c0_seq1:73-1224(+)